MYIPPISSHELKLCRNEGVSFNQDSKGAIAHPPEVQKQTHLSAQLLNCIYLATS